MTGENSHGSIEKTTLVHVAGGVIVKYTLMLLFASRQKDALPFRK